MVIMDKLVLFLILNKTLVFSVEYDDSCAFVICGLYYVEVCFFYSQFAESFNHKWALDFVKYFSASIDMTM